MAIYGYCRVSTLRQADEGESLAVQQRTVEGYAMMHGLTISQMFVERGVSGGKPLVKRPQGVALLAATRAGDAIITPKLDRMFRSALDALDMLAKFKAKHIGLHMIDVGGDVTDGSISKLVFAILAAVAEAERDRTRERIVTVKADQRSRGRYLGGIKPFGYTVTGTNGDDGRMLVPDMKQQAMIEKARNMRKDRATLMHIQAQLLQDGYKISISGLWDILRRA